MRRTLAPLLLALTLVACGSEAASPGGGDATGAGGGSATSSAAMGTGSGGASTSAGEGGAGGGGVETLDEILAALRADRDGTLLAESSKSGWPVPVEGGVLFVSTDPALPLVAGDHDQWAGTPMHDDAGFRWVVIDVPAGDHYKLTDGSTFAPDPWARAYTYDEYGEISLVAPSAAHIDRWLGVGDAKMQPRTLRVWVPAEPVDHVLYAHDGQNLFDPEAPWGGWHLQDTVPPGMLVVGIDNTPARMDEYTHVEDDIDGQVMGGQGDAYDDFLEHTVRPLVAAHYGEKGPLGVLGSSLGGLISFHVADRNPGTFAFAASLSGTMGWGSIGADTHNETMIERYAKHGHQPTVLYLDSGGYGTTCADADGDGVDDDDAGSADNYCENAQMKQVLEADGWQDGVDLFYVWDQGAEHDEAAWAARVATPLAIFSEL
jgi:predicted alpha/beta superfamily hydrolase